MRLRIPFRAYSPQAAALVLYACSRASRPCLYRAKDHDCPDQFFVEVVDTKTASLQLHHEHPFLAHITTADVVEQLLLKNGLSSLAELAVDYIPAEAVQVSFDDVRAILVQRGWQHLVRISPGLVAVRKWLAKEEAASEQASTALDQFEDKAIMCLLFRQTAFDCLGEKRIHLESPSERLVSFMQAVSIPGTVIQGTPGPGNSAHGLCCVGLNLESKFPSQSMCLLSPSKPGKKRSRPQDKIPTPPELIHAIQHRQAASAMTHAGIYLGEIAPIDMSPATECFSKLQDFFLRTQGITPRDVKPAITLTRELIIWEAAGDSTRLLCLPTHAERTARIMADLFAGSAKVSKVVRALARLAKGEGDSDYLSIPQYPSTAAWRLFLPSSGGDLESVLAELRTREPVFAGENAGVRLPLVKTSDDGSRMGLLRQFAKLCVEGKDGIEDGVVLARSE
jgi:hypothetical protein